MLGPYSSQFAQAAVSPQAHQAALMGAKALALTTLDLLLDEALRRRIRQEFEAVAPGGPNGR